MELEFIANKVYYKIFDLKQTVSTGIYSKKRVKDAAKLAEIEQNIANIKSEYGAKQLIILNQVHGDNVIYAGGEGQLTEDEASLEGADGSVTAQIGCALAVLTADCVPILLASDDGKVVGSAHCGWKSAKADIIKQIKKKMLGAGAGRIKAIIGPAIAQQSYEVDGAYYANFVSDDEKFKRFFIESKKEGRYMFDLVGFVKHKLQEEDIELKLNIEEDTYSMPDKYPSYRRHCHRGEEYSRNILSTIMIKT